MIYNPACEHCRQKRRRVNTSTAVEGRRKRRRDEYGANPVGASRFLSKCYPPRNSIHPFQRISWPNAILGNLPSSNLPGNPALMEIVPTASQCIPEAGYGQIINAPCEQDELGLPNVFDEINVPLDMDLPIAPCEISDLWADQVPRPPSGTNWLPPTPVLQDRGDLGISRSSSTSTSISPESSTPVTEFVSPVDTLVDFSLPGVETLAMNGKTFPKTFKDTQTYPAARTPSMNLPYMFDTPLDGQFDFALAGIGGESLLMQ